MSHFSVYLCVLSSERALYSFECAFHPMFSLTSGTSRLDYRRAENRFVLLFLGPWTFYIFKKSIIICILSQALGAYHSLKIKNGNHWHFRICCNRKITNFTLVTVTLRHVGLDVAISSLIIFLWQPQPTTLPPSVLILTYSFTWSANNSEVDSNIQSPSSNFL